jgi:hypothetical protein
MKTKNTIIYARFRFRFRLIVNIVDVDEIFCVVSNRVTEL